MHDAGSLYRRPCGYLYQEADTDTRVAMRDVLARQRIRINGTCGNAWYDARQMSKLVARLVFFGAVHRQRRAHEVIVYVHLPQQ